MRLIATVAVYTQLKLKHVRLSLPKKPVGHSCMWYYFVDMLGAVLQCALYQHRTKISTFNLVFSGSRDSFVLPRI